MKPAVLLAVVAGVVIVAVAFVFAKKSQASSTPSIFDSVSSIVKSVKGAFGGESFPSGTGAYATDAQMTSVEDGED